MPNTGYDWDAAWTPLQSSVVLTQGGTVQDISAIVDNDIKAGCEVGVEVTYSSEALSGTGLVVNVLRDVDGTDFEGFGDEPWGFEMKFLASNTIRRTFSVDPSEVSKFKIGLNWGNTTSGAVATVSTFIKQSDIPAAS